MIGIIKSTGGCNIVRGKSGQGLLELLVLTLIARHLLD